ncbi:hypothetical protein CCR75_006813 [Bremia lactucae]|uniref:Uncharacterized protein n=1 Tax=Bremia lactucae TaxID=4779 RepID=A0A976IC17_BRELC|nr:hypothetical protein CCR75_006813 [Bremia lactucae]
MSDVNTPSRPLPLMLPGSTRPNYRGKCLYKTGKCLNERALKTSGAAHNLCDEHRNRQNQHQRKLDAKNRLHKRERRKVDVASNGDRVVPYPAWTKRQKTPAPVDAIDGVESIDGTAPSSRLTDTTTKAAEAISSNFGLPALLVGAINKDVTFMLNSPQPTQVSKQHEMEDFDGIVVPLPPYLEGQERINFRTRIYQRVFDLISEECLHRYGANGPLNSISSDATEVKSFAATKVKTKFTMSNKENVGSKSSDL